MKKENKKVGKKEFKKKINLIKNTFFWILAAVIFFGILGYSIISNIRVGNVRTEYFDKIDDLQRQIKEAEDKKALLEKGLSKVGETEYLEEIARKQFGLKAPGEEVAVVVKDQPNQNNNTETDNAVASKSNPWNPLTWWRWLKGK